MITVPTCTSSSVSPDSSVPHDLEEKIASEVKSLSPATAAAAAAAAAATTDSKEGSDGSGSESDSGSDSGSERSDEEDNNEGDTKNNDGLSEYERLRLARIRKNEECLRQLGLLKEEPKTTSSTNKRKRKTPTPETQQQHFEPARRQPKRQAKGRLSDELLWLSGLRASTSRTKEFLATNNNTKSSRKTRPCGECAGCTREDNCNTCVYCVERINGKFNKNSRRCIFRVCRGNSNQENRPEPTEDEQKHSDLCAVCSNGGDLILCDDCNRGFHSNCHEPKIRKIPGDDEVWRCMECHATESHHNQNGFLMARLPPDDNTTMTKLIKVKVLKPADPDCEICHIPCAAHESLHCRACDNDFHLLCQQLDAKPKGGAVRVWRCITCRESNAPLLEQYTMKAKTPKKQINLELYEGEHDDDCYVCINGGVLVCCDFCPKVFHCKCHVPPLPEIPSGIWRCCECYAGGRNRMTRCGECKACRAQDCGKCKFCLDKAKFGGRDKLKKPCILRECPYQSFAETFVEGKIPGEIRLAKKKQKKS